MSKQISPQALEEAQNLAHKADYLVRRGISWDSAEREAVVNAIAVALEEYAAARIAEEVALRYAWREGHPETETDTGWLCALTNWDGEVRAKWVKFGAGTTSERWGWWTDNGEPTYKITHWRPYYRPERKS